MGRLAWVPVWLAAFLYALIATKFASRACKTLLRNLGALVVATAGYLLVMLGVALVFHPEGSNAAMVFAGGMAAGTMVGASLASLVFQDHCRSAGVIGCIGLALFYPAYLAVTSDATAPIQAMLSLYLIATTLGGYCAVLALSWPTLVGRPGAFKSGTATI